MPKKVVNDYIKYQQTKDHLIFNSPELSVPKQVLYVNKKGDKKLINTLTKSGKLSTRENKSALKLKTNDSKNKIILNDGITLYRRHLLTNNDIALKTDDLETLKTQYKRYKNLLSSGITYNSKSYKEIFDKAKLIEKKLNL